MSTIQFKRNLSFGGDLVSAIDKIRNLNPAIAPGEPLLCSYNDNGNQKYLLAIGINESGDIRIIPAFSNLSELDDYIKAHVNELNLKDNISEESDFEINGIGKDNKPIFKIKDNLKNIWIDLNNE